MLSVSVVIPAYNSEKYIRRSIERVLKQTVLPLEIIVVDDGSTDETAAIAKSYGGIVRGTENVDGDPPGEGQSERERGDAPCRE